MGAKEMPPDASFNSFTAAQAQFDHIADLMALDEAARKLLRIPAHEHRLALPVRLDGGNVEVFQGFRVQHNDVRGPAWGGVRFHPLETIDTVRALAMWTTWKTALVDIPLGGSMGGVICDPHDLSATEIERICRMWIRKVASTIGPQRDVPSPDIMTSGRHMTWMLDEYEALHRNHVPGAITGKTLGAGGSLGRVEATGYGLVYTLREALKELGIDPAATSASVQGFGNVAQHAIELFTQIGGTVTCVASWDPSAGAPVAFRKPDGIDLAELRSVSDRLGGIDRERAEGLGYVILPGDDWLAQDVDILIPAALEHQITIANVSSISDRVRIVAEGANGPTDPEAESVLTERGVFVIPDLLANAGGVICSYFEQVQSNMNYYWALSEVLSKLDRQLTTAFFAISDLARSKNLSMRDASLVIAIDRVASLCRERGWL
jgi:glutamate dehydrogenase (NAD(P)+)